MVIAIIGILSGITLQQINTARERARDALRLDDMHTIEVALRAFIIDNEGIPNTYLNQGGPPGHNGDGDPGCTVIGGLWDRSTVDGPDGIAGYPFIPWLVQDGYLSRVPLDPLNKIISGDGCAVGTGHTYLFFGKAAGVDGCPASLGKHFILAINDMESHSGSWPTSPNHQPGALCPGLVYNGTFEWVTVIPEGDHG